MRVTSVLAPPTQDSPAVLDPERWLPVSSAARVEQVVKRDVAMKWLSMLLGLTLVAVGCAQPYTGRGYAPPATHRSHAGMAADAQPKDVQSALQKYIGAN